VLEKQLAVEQGRVVETTHTIASVEKNYQAALKGQELARIEAARAQLSVEHADQVAAKAEKQCAELQKELVQLRKESHQSETRAAVAEASVQTLEKKCALRNKPLL
jgi:multidrug resistance efflux pump